MADAGGRVPLTVTSPAQRAAARARPFAMGLGVLALLVTLSLILLPTGPALGIIMGSALVALLAGLAVGVFAKRFRRPLQGAPLPTLAASLASIMLVGSGTIRYFTNQLLAPFSGPPESPWVTLLWALGTAVPVSAFTTWAMAPIKPRP